MKTFSYSRGIRAALVGIATTGARYTVWLSTVGAASALLWVSSTTAAEQSLPGATVENVGGQIADAWFGVDQLRKVVQIYASRQLPPARSSVDNARNGFQAGSADLSIVFESERRLRTVQLDLQKLKVELQTKYAEMERLAGGSL
jgi:outer membrane protein TolC